MPSNRTERVNIPLTKSEKVQWDDATGDGERFSSLAELARTSVHRELEGYHGGQKDQRGGENAALANSIEEMAGTMSQLDSTVNDIRNRIDRLEGQVAAESPEMELESVIYDLLPTNPEAGEGVTASELARQYGFDQDETAQALDQLASRTSTVVCDQPPKEVIGIPADSDAEPPLYYYRTEGGDR